jgi:hypothetical protein
VVPPDELLELDLPPPLDELLLELGLLPPLEELLLELELPPLEELLLELDLPPLDELLFEAELTDTKALAGEPRDVSPLASVRLTTNVFPSDALISGI